MGKTFFKTTNPVFYNKIFSCLETFVFSLNTSYFHAAESSKDKRLILKEKKPLLRAKIFSSEELTGFILCNHDSSLIINSGSISNARDFTTGILTLYNY